MASFQKAVEIKLASFPSLVQKSKLISIQQPLSLHSDLFLVSLLLDFLKAGKRIIFFAFRENFAHYSAISKRLGVALEQYISNQHLKYVQTFLTPWTVDLPMTEVSPPTYTVPSNKAVHMPHKEALADWLKKSDFSNHDCAFVDCLSFLNNTPGVVYQIYEKAGQADIQIVIGGQRQGALLTSIFGKESEIKISLQQHVGGFGKLKLRAGNTDHRLLWKISQGRFQVSSSATF